jgi:curved DNA-binding protein CbpA
MKSVTEEIFKDQRLLTRFVRQICLLPDTPALIQFVAGDEDYLLVCSRVVNASAGDAMVLKELTEIGRRHGLDFQVLKEKLTPVALALGLAVSSENQSDYYELLGVPWDADAADIKKAFRKRVRKVHPDTSAEMTDSNREFIHLKAAYQTLSDPVLRAQYDETLQHVSLWKEKADHINKLPDLNPQDQSPQSGPDKIGSAFHWAGIRRGGFGFRSLLNPLIAQNTNQKQPGRSKIFYQLGILFLLMILAVFIFDFLYRQNSIFDGDPTVKQEQVNEPQTVKEGSPKKSNIKPQPQITLIRSANYNPQIKFLNKKVSADYADYTD